MHANCKAHLNICHMEFALYKLIIIFKTSSQIQGLFNTVQAPDSVALQIKHSSSLTQCLGDTCSVQSGTYKKIHSVYMIIIIIHTLSQSGRGRKYEISACYIFIIIL